MADDDKKAEGTNPNATDDPIKKAEDKTPPENEKGKGDKKPAKADEKASDKKESDEDKELRARLKALEKENESLKSAEDQRKKEADEAELSAKELLAKREAELKEVKEKQRIADVSQDLGFTHKIFRFAPMNAEDAEKGLTDADIKAGLESFKDSLDDYFEKNVKAVETPGAATGNDTKAQGGKDEPKKSAAERFGWAKTSNVS